MTCPIIVKPMSMVTIYSVLRVGIRFRRSSLGGSVANARAAILFMIRLIQSIWTAVKGEDSTEMAPMKTMVSATRLTVS